MGFTACATHAPMSEMVMFTPKDVRYSVNNNTLDSIATYYSKYSFSGSLEQRFMDYNKLINYSKEEFNDSKIDDSGKAPTISLNSILLNQENDSFGLNIAMLPSIGIDATVRISEKNYLTIGHTAWGGQQIIIQRRMHYNQTTGSSLGIFYENIYQSRIKECYSTLCLPSSPDRNQVFYIKSFGLRGFLLLSDGMKNRSFLKLNGKVGLITDYPDVYGSVGISIGLF